MSIRSESGNGADSGSGSGSGKHSSVRAFSQVSTCDRSGSGGTSGKARVGGRLDDDAEGEDVRPRNVYVLNLPQYMTQ